MTDFLMPEQQLTRLRDQSQRRELGQFFTPEPLAKYLAEAIMDVSPSTVLDPAVGGGRLLRALPAGPALFGLDVDPDAVRLAGEALPGAEMAVGDFLAQGNWPLTEVSFDAIVANPPYIRHHRLSSEQKALRLPLGDEVGITISSLSDYYVYFFFEAMRRLNDDGRLAFITPARFLDASYGSAVKSLLLQEGTIDQIVVFERGQDVFDDVRTAAAVTVVTKRSSRKHIVFRVANYNGKLEHLDECKVDPQQLLARQSWSDYLPRREAVRATTHTIRLDEVIRVRRGLATGSNEFFCLSEPERIKLGIPKYYLVPLAARCRNLPETEFTSADWKRRLDDGERVWLLWLADKRIQSQKVLDHLARGEADGVHLRTMCNRGGKRPWYVVENVGVPDYLFTYMSKSPLRFVENTAQVRALTSMLCGWLQPDVDPDWARELLCSPDAAKAITAAAHDQGAGLRKIEPGRLREVQLPVPRHLL